MPETIKRQVAFKLRVGDLAKGKSVMDGERFSALELGDKRVIRVNIVANVIDKYVSEGEKKYSNLTIDDASGQIQVRMFGDDVYKFSGIGQGDTIMVIGMLRVFNDELYILPEIITKKDPRYLLVRKLEVENEKPKDVPKNEIKALRDRIIEMIKEGEELGGVETEKIVMNLEAAPELINEEIRKILEEGLAYEPRPGMIRYLG